MAKFNDIIGKVKQILKDNLTADNTELFTQIDKEVDNIVSAHKETEEKLSQTQDKLLEVVKGTSFKTESEQSKKDESTEEVVSIDEAFENGLNEIEANRK